MDGVRTVRAATFAAVILAGALGSEAASACTIIGPFPQEGETWEQAWEREELRRQQELWVEADVVFLGEVLSERLVTDDRVEVRLRVVTTIRGQSDASQVLDWYTPGWSTCGPPDYPRVGEQAIFYADRNGLPFRLLADRQLSIFSHFDVRRVRDPQVPEALRAAARRLRQ